MRDAISRTKGAGRKDQGTEMREACFGVWETEEEPKPVTLLSIILQVDNAASSHPQLFPDAAPLEMQEEEKEHSDDGIIALLKSGLGVRSL